jgi:hypothetical protein
MRNEGVSPALEPGRFARLILRELDFELLLKTHQVIRQRRTSVANINDPMGVCS